MKIKTKLILGMAFLFTAFLTVSLFSLYFIFNISRQNNLITKNNNLTIGYVENMLQSIDKINDIKASSLFKVHYMVNESEFSRLLKVLEQNLGNQENNITETGERELTRSVRDNFEKLKTLFSESSGSSVTDKPGFYYTNILPAVNEIKFDLFAISDLNMNAIVNKNIKANETANHSYLVLSIIASVCFLVFFIFIFGFPRFITEPIEILTKSVKEIANKNFETRVNFKTNDEFGQISEAFNDMAGKLEEYEKINIRQLVNGKERAESILNRIDEAILVLDENQNITFVNIPAEKLLGLSNVNIINKNAPDLATNNELLRYMIRDLNQNNVKSTDTFTVKSGDIKTVYSGEMHIITSYNRKEDFIVHIGYEISLKKISKVFD